MHWHDILDSDRRHSLDRSAPMIHLLHSNLDLPRLLKSLLYLLDRRISLLCLAREHDGLSGAIAAPLLLDLVCKRLVRADRALLGQTWLQLSLHQAGGV